MVPLWQEKRKYYRFGTNMALQFRVENRILNGLNKNISEDGICFTTSEFIPVNTQIALSLTTKEEPLKAMGKVSWIQKLAYGDRYNIGVQFTDITENNKKRILEIIDKGLSPFLLN